VKVNPLGLPEAIRACLFDMDGVLTRTASVHAAAWKETFDRFLREHAESTGTPFQPFDEVSDYEKYVDGQSREDGVRSLLAARHIDADRSTVERLAAAKDKAFAAVLERSGVAAYDGSLRYLSAVRAAGIPCAVVTSSRHCADILRAVGLTDSFAATIDGNVIADRQLAGKPAPDSYLAAAQALHVDAEHAAVFEDAQAGVAAGRAGGFGWVVGVDRLGQADQLRAHGADIVVADLADLLAAA
jgi:beta-phosphoglucomutase family hydrolase